MTAKMTRYTHADFADDDSINSVQLTEGITSNATHIRYHPGHSLWRLRSRLEQALIVLALLLLFTVVVLTIALNSAESRATAYMKRGGGGGAAPAPCLNASCVHVASAILESMDVTVDPCEDFYAYACAGWMRANPIPDGRALWGTFTKLEQQNHLVLKHFLEQPVENLKSKAEIKAKLYYDSCMDSNDTIETLGAKPMLDLLQKLGGWNITANFTLPASWTVQGVVQVVQNRFNIGAFFAYTVGEDDKNSTRNILQIDQSGLSLPVREYYLNRTEHGKIVDAYLEYMVKVGVLLGGELNSTRRQMEDVMAFEVRLANITTPAELRRDEEMMYHLMTVAELQERAKFLDWRMFFEDALRIVNRKVTQKEKILVYAPDYLGNLSLLVEEYENTTSGKIILNNYMIWQTVRSLSTYLSKAFRDAYNKGPHVAMYGNAGGEDTQWKFCIQDTTLALGFPIGAIFIREVFHQEWKQSAERMINDVRNAFKENFKNLKWMDEETRKAAVIKADAMSDMIGYPDFLRNASQLDEKFDNLTVRNDTYFDNNVQISVFTLRKSLEKINEEVVNRTTWNMAPSAVNAYYTPSRNQMVFPAGILQPPFYNIKFPASLNYGGMGVVMGHELAHGFDDQGREYDKDGNLKHWWKNKTIEKFKQRTKCVVDQYDKYKIFTKNVNGNQTLGENIADNGGLRAAYHAYLKIEAKTSPPPPPLPGLPLTHRQLFFVAFAQVWCSAATKESSLLQIEKDTHVPSQYRVIGALSNLKEFADEFGCKLGSRMNPKSKCEVW